MNKHEFKNSKNSNVGVITLTKLLYVSVVVKIDCLKSIEDGSS